MKKIILIIGIIISISSTSFAQFIMFEQDVRFITKPENSKPIPTTFILADQPIKGGLSMGPFALTTSGWNEALWFVNYNYKAVSFGFGAGMEQLDTWSWRLSPWIKVAPVLKDTTTSIEIFSLWEFGKGRDNWWYSNHITYESKRLSLGVMGKRFYGVGPVAGVKLALLKWNFKLSGAGLYDFEDKSWKPTVILTINN